MFMDLDILTILGLDYRVAFITLYFVVPGIKIQINRMIRSHKNLLLKKVKKSTCLKWTYGHFGNDYRVATLSKSYLTTKGITMQSLKSISRQSTILTCLN